VTNAHVIEDEIMCGVEIHFPSAAEGARGPHQARLLSEDSRRDLAILNVQTTLPTLALARSYKFRKVEDVTIIGSPGLGAGLLLQNAVSQGILSTETVLDGQNYYQLGASVNPGNSGGPAIDSSGEVVGIVTASARRQQAIGFCIPVDDVNMALTRLDGTDPRASPKLDKLHNRAAAARVFHHIGAVCSDALKLYVSGMKSAQANRTSADEGIQVTNSLIGDRLALLRSAAIRALESDARAVILDPELPPNIRRDLGELWSLVREMKDSVERPRGTVQNFSSQVITRTEHFHRSLRKLESDLNIKFEN
jgi:S1-C subfamily serine protease